MSILRVIRGGKRPVYICRCHTCGGTFKSMGRSARCRACRPQPPRPQFDPSRLVDAPGAPLGVLGGLRLIDSWGRG